MTRTQAGLDELRRAHPDGRVLIDAAVRAFNESDVAGARAAFVRIYVLIAADRAELTAEAARSKHGQATLFSPLRVLKGRAAPVRGR